jgi:hypothetical protein
VGSRRPTLVAPEQRIGQCLRSFRRSLGTVALTDRVRVLACSGDPSPPFRFCLVRRLPVPLRT